ncbi:hypothetical protein [Treponema zioleckii]|uniref:hypothetical protein n=1 Tax=Treponema zioleckii TaxID=331680 RepID=UPI00168ACF3D|nr:hypothetical protein [Treponema zioleckii]
MKKSILKSFIALSVLSIFAFTSCQDVIFDDIRKEVKLEDAQISGSVNSIVWFGSDIYAQNGNIWKKSAANLNSAHNWVQTSKPTDVTADYKYVNKLAADSTYLYAQLTLLDEDTEDDGEIESQGCEIWYSSDGETWSGPLTISNSDGAEVSRFTSGEAVLFCTNAYDSSHRFAYLRVYDSPTEAYKIYRLNGETAEELTTGDDDRSTVPTTGASSCAWFNGSVYFSSGKAMATNEVPAYTDSNGNEVAAVPATYLYASSSDLVYYTTDGSNWDSADLNCSTIYSMALTQDYIIVGTADGIEHSALTDSVPASGVSDFDTNAASTLSSYYEVHVVFTINPAFAEQSASVYGTTTYSGSSSSTSATQSNCGIWAYFASRGSWNRE